jgi:hypothetical protein
VTMPDIPSGPDGLLAQVLLELGRQTTQLAVANTKLDTMIAAKDDHEQRIRHLESGQAQVQGGRDAHARVVSWVAAAAAAASGVANYLHH